MTADSSEDRPQDEDRLIALLALRSQELPERKVAPEQLLRELDRDQLDATQIEALHGYLDANPEAFEAFLQRHRQPAKAPEAAAVASSKRQLPTAPWLGWLSGLRVMPLRYVLAFGVAAVCTVLAVQTFVGDGSRVAAAIEGGYSDLAAQMDPAKAAELAIVQDQRGPRFGFGPQGAGASSQAREFASGVAGGRRRLSSGVAAPSPVDKSIYYALGEWNVLLWAASRNGQPLPAVFWQTQHQRHELIVAGLKASTDPDPLVVAHLQRVDALLVSIKQKPATRAARALAEELTLFREQFAPEQGH